jgi:hypothetical protein
MRTPTLLALFLAVSAAAAAGGFWFARRQPEMRELPREPEPAPPLTSQRREVPSDGPLGRRGGPACARSAARRTRGLGDGRAQQRGDRGARAR